MEVLAEALLSLEVIHGDSESDQNFISPFMELLHLFLVK